MDRLLSLVLGLESSTLACLQDLLRQIVLVYQTDSLCKRTDADVLADQLQDADFLRTSCDTKFSPLRAREKLESLGEVPYSLSISAARWSAAIFARSLSRTVSTSIGPPLGPLIS